MKFDSDTIQLFGLQRTLWPPVIGGIPILAYNDIIIVVLLSWPDYGNDPAIHYDWLIIIDILILVSCEERWPVLIQWYYCGLLGQYSVITVTDYSATGITPADDYSYLFQLILFIIVRMIIFIVAWHLASIRTMTISR